MRETHFINELQRSERRCSRGFLCMTTSYRRGFQVCAGDLRLLSTTPRYTAYCLVVSSVLILTDLLINCIQMGVQQWIFVSGSLRIRPPTETSPVKTFFLSSAKSMSKFSLSPPSQKLEMTDVVHFELHFHCMRKNKEKRYQQFLLPL